MFGSEFEDGEREGWVGQRTIRHDQLQTLGLPPPPLAFSLYHALSILRLQDKSVVVAVDHRGS